MHSASRRLLTTAGVAVLHGAALWGLLSGPQRRPAELLVPVATLSEWAPAAPLPAPTPQPPAASPRPPAPAGHPVAMAAARPAAMTAAASPVPSEAAPAASVETAGAPPPTAAALAPAAPAAAQPARVEPPSSDAAYLQNPRPTYPPASKRLGEQGKVLVRVLIGTDGAAQKAEIGQSSGFDRLDQAALQAALKWRYLPGKRAGVPETMWWTVPINFVLE